MKLSIQSITLMFISILFIQGCFPSKERLEQEIIEANYCEQATDCENIGDHCPFGCAIVVNGGEAERIEDKIESYIAVPGNACDYDCDPIGEISCENNLCVVGEYEFD